MLVLVAAVDSARGHSSRFDFRDLIFLRQKKNIPMTIAITATGTTTPIATFSPVDRLSPLELVFCAGVLEAGIDDFVVLALVDDDADDDDDSVRSRLRQRISIIGAARSIVEYVNSVSAEELVADWSIAVVLVGKARNEEIEYPLLQVTTGIVSPFVAYFLHVCAPSLLQA